MRCGELKVDTSDHRSQRRKSLLRWISCMPKTVTDAGVRLDIDADAVPLLHEASGRNDFDFHRDDLAVL